MNKLKCILSIKFFGPLVVIDWVPHVYGEFFMFIEEEPFKFKNTNAQPFKLIEYKVFDEFTGVKFSSSCVDTCKITTKLRDWCQAALLFPVWQSTYACISLDTSVSERVPGAGNELIY